MCDAAVARCTLYHDVACRFLRDNFGSTAWHTKGPRRACARLATLPIAALPKRSFFAFVQLASLSDLEELLQRRLPGDVVNLEIGAVRRRLCPSAVHCLA
jgi:hypothetical protein